ncbi:hypothetical protein LC574_09900 [Nostoc sp. CHAB 5715]|nr:hypothetical protein [Nostoc sp. CHAB 5836]MCC5621610.1 hypothetical protein [Nostoc sp. CHAB 5715]
MHDRLDIYRTSNAYAMMGWLSFVGLVCSTILLLIEWHLGEYFTVEFIGGIAGFLICGGFYFWNRQQRLDGRPHLVITRDFLIARDLSDEPIRWSDIEAVELANVMVQPILSLRLNAAADAVLKLNARAALSKWVSRSAGVQTHGISLVGIDQDVAAVAAALDAMAGHARHRDVQG